jgi:cytochrome b561
MQWMNTRDRYGVVAVWLHWSVAILVLVLYALGSIGDEVPRGPMRAFVRAAHESVGILLFAMVGLRLLWHALNPMPAPPPGTGRFANLAAGLAHWALYALLLAIPVTGIAAIWLQGRDVSLFATTLPSVLTPNRQAAHALEDVHEVLANAILGVAAIHAAAAAWHHVVRRDDVLRRMLPGRSTAP